MIYAKSKLLAAAARLFVILSLFLLSQSATAQAAASALSEADETAAEEYVLYFENEEDWLPYVWAWNEEENCVADGVSWPGEPMTLVSGTLYKWTAPEGKIPTGIIISNEGITKAGGGNLVFVNGATYYPDGSYAVSSPLIIFSPDGCAFASEAIDVTATAVNATSGWIKINGGEELPITSSMTFSIGEGVDYGSTITVSWSATNENETCAGNISFAKTEVDIIGKSFLYFDNTSEWLPYVWAWNEEENCVAGKSYPGDAMIYLGGTKWVWTAPEGKVPTGVIISDYGKTKAGGDLDFVNGATYYPDGTFTGGSVKVSVGADGVATYGGKYALNFADTGLEAYYAPQEGVSGATVTLKKIADGRVPANTGVLLKSTDGGAHTADVPLTTTEADFTDNCLRAVLSEYDCMIRPFDPETNTYNYFFAKRTYADESLLPLIGFFKLTSDTQSALNKAYLNVSTELVDASEVQMFSLHFGEGEATAIGHAALEKENAAPAAVYTLTGVRVANPTKGFYIRNGKKVIIK